MTSSVSGQDEPKPTLWLAPERARWTSRSLASVSVHKHPKKEVGQYPAILTSHLANNPYIVNGSLCNLCALAPGLALHIFTIQCWWVQRSPQKMRKKWQRRSTPNQRIVDFCRESLGKCPLKYIIKRVQECEPQIMVLLCVTTLKQTSVLLHTVSILL